jgi:hypothetical protein
MRMRSSYITSMWTAFSLSSSFPYFCTQNFTT